MPYLPRMVGAYIAGLLITNGKLYTAWAFDWYQTRWPWMTLNGVMAVTLRYFTEFGKPALQKTIFGGIYAKVIVILLRVQCRRKESSRSLSHLLMSFLFYLLIWISFWLTLLQRATGRFVKNTDYWWLLIFTAKFVLIIVFYRRKFSVTYVCNNIFMTCIHLLFCYTLWKKTVSKTMDIYSKSMLNTVKQIQRKSLGI